MLATVTFPGGFKLFLEQRPTDAKDREWLEVAMWDVFTGDEGESVAFFNVAKAEGDVKSVTSDCEGDIFLDNLAEQAAAGFKDGIILTKQVGGDVVMLGNINPEVGGPVIQLEGDVQWTLVDQDEGEEGGNDEPVGEAKSVMADAVVSRLLGEESPEAKPQFQIKDDWLDLVVDVTDGNTGLNIHFKGTLGGKPVEGVGRYGMARPDDNRLDIEQTEPELSDEDFNNLESSIDDAPDFQPWVTYAMGNTPGA